MQYESYDELRRARSTLSIRSQSASSLMHPSLGSAASFSSLNSRSSNWEAHVKVTLLRNERIRLQSEATKLRAAFVRHDTRLTGSVPTYMLAACLKAGGS